MHWLEAQTELLEKQVARALNLYSASKPLGQWARSIVGIGPIISAGLLAHIDIGKCETAGAIWSFAGLNPDAEWARGQKRPWNADLKKLCWKIGESFVKTSGIEGSHYGPVYAARKVQEKERNAAGVLAAQAKVKLDWFKIGKDTDAYAAYSQGKLPPAQLHARAKRYAVKLFMAHYFKVGYFLHHARKAPKPYVLEHLGHTHYLEPPNTDLVPRWR